MKKIFVTILVIVMLMTLVGCGNAHIAKSTKSTNPADKAVSMSAKETKQPETKYESKQSETKQAVANNVKQTESITFGSTENEKIIEQPKNTQVSSDVEQKELLLQDYISKVGGQEAIGYNENLNRVKETGKMITFDNNYNAAYIDISLSDYVNFALNDILTKYPDINERSGSDWEYINSALNLPDHSTYYSAFYDCDNGIWGNSLTGLFNDKNELDFVYNTFISKATMKEKADYLKGIIGVKKALNSAQTIEKDNIGETKYVNGHKYEYQNTPNGKMWVDLDYIEDASEDEDEEYEREDNYRTTKKVQKNSSSYSSNDGSDNYTSYNNWDVEEYDISQHEYEVRDNYPKYVLKYNEENGHSYSDYSLPSLYSEQGNQLVSFQFLTKDLDVQFSNRLYDFSKENHVCQIEFESSEITSKTKNGLIVTVYGTVEWTGGDTKNIEVYCKCDKNLTATGVSFSLKD